MRIILPKSDTQFRKGNKASQGVRAGKGVPRDKKIVDKARIVEALHPEAFYFTADDAARIKKQLWQLAETNNEMAVKFIADKSLRALPSLKTNLAVKLDPSLLDSMGDIAEAMNKAINQVKQGEMYVEDMETLVSAYEKLFKVRKEYILDVLETRMVDLETLVKNPERGH